jgi:hypothetical protein
MNSPTRGRSTRTCGIGIDSFDDVIMTLFADRDGRSTEGIIVGTKGHLLDAPATPIVPRAMARVGRDGNITASAFN